MSFFNPLKAYRPETGKYKTPVDPTRCRAEVRAGGTWDSYLKQCESKAKHSRPFSGLVGDVECCGTHARIYDQALAKEEERQAINQGEIALEKRVAALGLETVHVPNKAQKNVLISIDELEKLVKAQLGSDPMGGRGKKPQGAAAVAAPAASEAPKLRLSRPAGYTPGDLEYEGTLGDVPVRLTFGTGANEGWTLSNRRNGKSVHLGTNLKGARAAAPSKLDQIK